VEIGPGLGILTNELVEKAKKVKTIEIDQKLIPYLNWTFKKYKSKLEIINQDALKFDLPTENYKLIANIPYYITSPILNHFLGSAKEPQKRPELIMLLMQKEVAEKICVQTGDHSVLSLQVQIYGEPKIIKKVSAGSFFPAPKVESAILKITPFEKPLVSDEKLFFKLIKGCFLQKRKTMSNSLIRTLNLPRAEVDQIMEKAGLKPELRPQHLSIQDWEKLIQFIVAQS